MIGCGRNSADLIFGENCCLFLHDLIRGKALCIDLQFFECLFLRSSFPFLFGRLRSLFRFCNIFVLFGISFFLVRHCVFWIRIKFDFIESWCLLHLLFIVMTIDLILKLGWINHIYEIKWNFWMNFY